MIPNLFYLRQLLILILVAVFCDKISASSLEENGSNLFEAKLPTVAIAILARNKAHTLPYFLTLLHELNYPRNRIALWIRSDHNQDNTIRLIQKWLNKVEHEYHSVNVILDDKKTRFSDENGPAHWSDQRFNHVIQLREDALNHARNIWADYMMFMDCDVFLTNPNTLKNLINHQEKVPEMVLSAPMLKSDGLYSNFWCGMTSEYYYERTEEYKPILHREQVGCHQVPMVHSILLINLKSKITDKLTFHSKKIPNYIDGPNDDIITFAMSANRSNIPLFVCNDHFYGYITVPLEQADDLKMDYLQLVNIKLEVVNNIPDREHFKPLGYDSSVFDENDIVMPYGEKDTFNFSKVYMINLARRPDRKMRMEYCFNELGLDATVVEAVDGRSLNDSVLLQIGVEFMPEFSDPYHQRPMTLGEIGCFLSHYNIWKQIVENKYETTMVLEDDIRFEPFFRWKVAAVMKDAKQLPEWDLIYLGRKRLVDSSEPWVSHYLVQAGYSYWTLGYVLSLRGAQKLLAAEPLKKLIPVDEYLPILFDKHPKENWKQHFPKRDLVAFSAAPLLLYPTHYIGEKGYVSDTEDSNLIPSTLITPPASRIESPSVGSDSPDVREDL